MDTPNEQTSIATWNIRLLNDPDEQSLVSYARHLLNATEDVIQIFQEQNLFQWTDIFLNSWNFYNFNEKKYASSNYKSVHFQHESITNKEANTFFEKQIKMANDGTSDIAPFEIVCLGKGSISVSPVDEKIVDNAIWFNSSLFVELYISIHTQSDAWLPISLNGVYQPFIYEENSVRLYRALQKISTTKQFDFYVANSQTKYAQNTGLGLINL